MASTPLAAALAAGRAAGLVVDEPVVLRDLTNLVVRLAPAPVVARVPLTFTRLRGREWLEAELRLVGELRDVGLPVTGPARDVGPVLSEHDGYLVSLWELVPEDAHAALDAHAAGSALRRLHDALADVDPTGLEHFARFDELTRLVSQLELREDERRDFGHALDAAAATVAGLDAPLQPVHGDAHLRNVISTPTPVWADWENVCLGPRELDVCALVIRGRDLNVDAALAGYGPFDEALVEVLLPLHALFLAAWTFSLAERIPSVRPEAERRLGWVRARLP